MQRHDVLASLRPVGQAIFGIGVVCLAVGTVAWMAAMQTGDGTEGGGNEATSPSPTSSPQPDCFTAPPVPGLLVLIVRDETQAGEIQTLLDDEAGVRALAGEPRRASWVLVSPGPELFRTLADDANLGATGMSIIKLVDVR